MAQTAAYSFRYCPLESGQYSIYHDSSHSQQAVLADTCRNVMNRHCCQISIAAAPETSLPSFKPHSSLVDSPTVYNLTMTGPIRNVMASRLELLQQCPIKININLSLPAIDCPNIDVLRTECEKIQEESQTEIAIVPPTFANRSSFVAQNRVSIVITGTPAKADHARIRFLVLLDKLSHLDSDTLHIPLELHNLICGKKRVCLQPIIEETSTNIYFPSPFTDFVDNDSDTKHGSAIYISGDHNNIARVKEMLNKLAVQKAKSMYHKEATLQARKLDWMLVHRRDDLRRIMHDNGSFIEFPALGANSGTVVVYAENRVNAERTLRLLNYLACSIYEACFYFSCCDNAIYGSQGTETGLNSITSVASLVSQLSAISGAEVTYNMETASMEILGTERAVRNVYQHLHEMTFLKIFHQDTVFNVELSNDQREFISGKKNGKINKIIKTSGAKIKFLPFSEYNFIIEVESASFTKALDGLTLLQEELPAEISFYVPESYHKRIIGVGGKNIQRIMKKYGVYVKFSNAEEFASLGGYYDNDDNVVARTPMKNQINLDNLRHAVMELISPKDKDFVTRSIEIPFRHHRILVHNHQDHFVQLTRKTNTRLLWPDHELASDAVTLMGPETQIDTAMHLVRSVIPEEYHFHVPESPALNSVLVFDAFRTLVVDRLRKELDIVLEVGPSSPSSTSSNSSDQPMSVLSPTLSNQQPLLSSPPPSATLADAPPMLAPSVACDTTDAVLCLKMTKANIDSLPAALDILVAFLGAHQVPLYDEPAAKLGVASSTSTTSKRSSASTSSIPDSFSHFSSKVLPTVGPADLPSPPPGFQHTQLPGYPSYSLFNYSSAGGTPFDASWKSFRDMNTRAADNIRAIFDSPMDQRSSEEGGFSSGHLSMPMSPSTYKFRNTPMMSHIPSSTGTDIWMNTPQVAFMNSSFSSTPTVSSPLNIDGGKMPSMPYGIDQSSGFYPYSLRNSLNKSTSTDYHHYVYPKSSTSTGSNSSMHSSKSMPETLRNHDMRNSASASSLRRHDDTTPIKAATLPSTHILTSKSSNFSVHTPNQSTPLLYPSATYSLSPSSSISSTIVAQQPLSATESAHHHVTDYPSLFAPHHSSTDETNLVQSLLNNMSLAPDEKEKQHAS